MEKKLLCKMVEESEGGMKQGSFEPRRMTDLKSSVGSVK